MQIFLFLRKILSNMWQRIQTLYLAVSTALIIALLTGTAATVNGTDGIVRISYSGLAKPYFLILLIILGLITLLALVTFKSRILQLRLSVLGGLVAAGTQIWLAYMYFTAPDGVVFRFTAIFPLVCAILNVLAARGAFMDQMMVESAYRIRESRRRRQRR